MIQNDYEIESIPESAWQVSRRSFMKRLAGGIAAGGALVNGTSASASPMVDVPQDLETAVSGTDPGDERYWHAVRSQFLLRDDLALMNAANLCPSPYPVMESVFKYTRDLDYDASFHNRMKYRQIREETREKMARLLGAHSDEIALVRNTSEANNVISTGYHLGAGDEVLLSDLNHPSNNQAWQVKARRFGFKINYVSVPVVPQSEDEIIDAFERAYTPATKVMSFTHVSNRTGLTMPAKRLCAAARARGVFSVVDGAQSFGALKIDLADMGCDAYTGSAHKWFMGPKEVGVLYVRKESQGAVWPSIVSAGWRDEVEESARKYEVLGQRDDAALTATGRGVEFHEKIGPARVEARMRQVATAIKEGLSGLPGIELSTSMDPALSAGVVIFKPGELDPRKVFDKLYNTYHIAGAGMGPNVRLSPHIYNTLDEADRAVTAVAEMLRDGV
ncbi:MAG: aminotransferase class V-fold PLP-dependent enzyme [Gemmatimonadetes bacterium]|nr:aminotransferase class V-fold PLP-dependent enzyme [Gemmatimonadota bacterium]MYB61967.1 aminotransferase class V-fold PLP-dependent enzyme [Gemmatimonadota bacterium]